MFCCTVLEGHIQTQIRMVLEMAGLLCFDCVTLVITGHYVLYIYSGYAKHASKKCFKFMSCCAQSLGNHVVIGTFMLADLKAVGKAMLVLSCSS